MCSFKVFFQFFFTFERTYKKDVARRKRSFCIVAFVNVTVGLSAGRFFYQSIWIKHTSVKCLDMVQPIYIVV